MSVLCKCIKNNAKTGSGTSFSGSGTYISGSGTSFSGPGASATDADYYSLVKGMYKCMIITIIMYVYIWCMVVHIIINNNNII